MLQYKTITVGSKVMQCWKDTNSTVDTVATSCTVQHVASFFYPTFVAFSVISILPLFIILIR